MLANPELRVVLVTIHVALRRALERRDFDAVLSTLRIAHAADAAWGQPAPRIAVAGLNPHAGEGGLFGDEEIRFIGPAVQAARAEGIDAQGPFPPDTVFMRARRGAFDLVVAMTHDHGLIPVKYLGVEKGVNVTLGLPLVRSANGFHVLKLVGRRTVGGTKSGAANVVQQTRARHILIKVSQIVSAAEARRKMVELKSRLDNGAAKFEDLARLYSNDGSASKGGELGWIYPGDTVPEFERAMNALKPGEVSQPVESPFGYHLIEVLERKTEELSRERQRLAARQALREQKLEEAYEDWLRQLRDRAYVEYRLDDAAR